MIKSKCYIEKLASLIYIKIEMRAIKKTCIDNAKTSVNKTFADLCR